jgi:hypothetical protein
MATSWLCATLLLLSHTVQATTTFGVGFSLSDEYGYAYQTPKIIPRLTSKHSVASVAFQENNRSWTWNVAKIAGSRLYTQTMDSASHHIGEMIPGTRLWKPLSRTLGADSATTSGFAAAVQCVFKVAWWSSTRWSLTGFKGDASRLENRDRGCS